MYNMLVHRHIVGLMVGFTISSNIKVMQLPTYILLFVLSTLDFRMSEETFDHPKENDFAEAKQNYRYLFVNMR